MLLSFTNQVADDIFSLLERGNPFTSLMFLSETRSIPNHTHSCHSVTSNVWRMSKHTRNNLRNHNDFRSRDLSISIV